MKTDSIMPEKLMTFEYYRDKLPLFLQNSYGFVEHFRIWYDLLVGETNKSGIVPTSNILLNLIRLFEPDYLEYINSFEDSKDGTKSDLLDKLAALFGLHRKFTVSYNLDGTNDTYALNLTNEELLMLIKIQIVNNYCEGSESQINAAYNLAGLSILQITDTDNPSAVSNICLFTAQNSDYEYSDNIRHMFLAGLLRIESMGIEYRYAILDLDKMLTWYDYKSDEEDNSLNAQYWSDKSVSLWSDDGYEFGEWTI